MPNGVYPIEILLYRGNQPRSVLRYHIHLEPLDETGQSFDEPLMMFLEAVRDAGATLPYASWGEVPALDAALKKQGVYPCEAFPSDADVIRIERQQTALLEYEAGFDDTLSIGVGRNVVDVEISQSDDGVTHEVKLCIQNANLTTHTVTVHVPSGATHATLTVVEDPYGDASTVYDQTLTSTPEEV